MQVERQITSPQGNSFTRKYWVNPNQVRDTDTVIGGAQNLPSNKKPGNGGSSRGGNSGSKGGSVDSIFSASGRDAKKSAIASAIAGGASRNDIISAAKKNGISWNEHDNPAINWMRASMAITGTNTRGTKATQSQATQFQATQSQATQSQATQSQATQKKQPKVPAFMRAKGDSTTTAGKGKMSASYVKSEISRISELKTAVLTQHAGGRMYTLEPKSGTYGNMDVSFTKNYRGQWSVEATWPGHTVPTTLTMGGRKYFTSLSTAHDAAKIASQSPSIKNAKNGMGGKRGLNLAGK